MTLMIELSPEKARLLSQAAARRGVLPAEYARELLEEGLQGHPTKTMPSNPEERAQASLSCRTVRLPDFCKGRREDKREPSRGSDGQGPGSGEDLEAHPPRTLRCRES